MTQAYNYIQAAVDVLTNIDDFAYPFMDETAEQGEELLAYIECLYE